MQQNSRNYSFPHTKPLNCSTSWAPTRQANCVKNIEHSEALVLTRNLSSESTFTCAILAIRLLDSAYGKISLVSAEGRFMGEHLSKFSSRKDAPRLQESGFFRSDQPLDGVGIPWHLSSYKSSLQTPHKLHHKLIVSTLITPIIVPTQCPR